MLRTLLCLFCLKQCFSFMILNNVSLVKNNYEMEYWHPSSPLPKHWDLREIDMVSPVKDQKDCAACWAFSVIANIESLLKMYKKTEVILSEQFLIDCDIDQGGCQDGSMVESFAKIVAHFKGVIAEKDYPYTNGQGACKVEVPLKNIFSVVGFRRVIGEERMRYYLYFFGPLSAGVVYYTTEYNFKQAPIRAERRRQVTALISACSYACTGYLGGPVPLSAAINSASMEYWKYEKGAIDDPSDVDCDPNRLNHAVLIVGYSVAYTDDGEEIPYWIIKNSWGTDFGDNGFYYLVRGRNACGIANDASGAYV